MYKLIYVWFEFKDLKITEPIIDTFSTINIP